MHRREIRALCEKIFELKIIFTCIYSPAIILEEGGGELPVEEGVTFAVPEKSDTSKRKPRVLCQSDSIVAKSPLLVV